MWVQGVPGKKSDSPGLLRHSVRFSPSIPAVSEEDDEDEDMEDDEDDDGDEDDEGVSEEVEDEEDTIQGGVVITKNSKKARASQRLYPSSSSSSSGAAKEGKDSKVESARGPEAPKKAGGSGSPPDEGPGKQPQGGGENPAKSAAGGSVSKANGSVANAGDSVGKAGKSVAKAGDSVGKAGKSVVKAGDSVGKAGKSVAKAGGSSASDSEASESAKKDASAKASPQLGPLSAAEFKAQSLIDLESDDPDALFVPDQVPSRRLRSYLVKVTILVKFSNPKVEGSHRRENKDSQEGDAEGRRPLDAKVRRWEHKEGVDPKDPEGCGTPVCAAIDGRPKRWGGEGRRHIKKTQVRDTNLLHYYTFLIIFSKIKERAKLLPQVCLHVQSDPPPVFHGAGAAVLHGAERRLRRRQ